MQKVLQTIMTGVLLCSVVSCVMAMEKKLSDSHESKQRQEEQQNGTIQGVETVTSKQARRLATYQKVTKKLELLNDQELTKLLEEAQPLSASGITGPVFSLELDGTKVFVKKLPLTDLEKSPDPAAELRQACIAAGLISAPITDVLESVVPFPDSTLLNTYEHGYKIYLNESNDKTINTIIYDGLIAYNLEQLGVKINECFMVTVTSTTGKIIAGATGVIDTYKNCGKCCFIGALWVDEQYRNCGLGTQIMRKCITYARSKNVPSIELQTYEFQDQAKGFFEKLGFIAVTTIPSAYTDSYFNKYYIMRRSLNTDDDYDTRNSLSDTLKNDYQFKLEESWNEPTCQTIVNNLKSYNEQKVGIQSDKHYTIFITSDSDEIIAGAVGRICSYNNENFCELDDLWVSNKCRQHSFGTKIINELAKYAKSKNCTLIELGTGQWQAKGFYEKSGFTAIATIPNQENWKNREWYIMRRAL